MQDSLNKIKSSTPKEWPFILTTNENKDEMEVQIQGSVFKINPSKIRIVSTQKIRTEDLKAKAISATKIFSLHWQKA